MIQSNKNLVLGLIFGLFLGIILTLVISRIKEKQQEEYSIELLNPEGEVRITT